MNTDEILRALSHLTPEQLQGILSQGNTNGRSPIKPRQLHDLRLQPSATDPRPLFVPSAEGFRDVPETHSPYPRLLWHTETGQEITVHSLEEHQAKGEMWTGIAPMSRPIDPVERAQQMFDALSEEDQQIVLEQQRQARIAAVSAAMSGLTPSQTSALGVPAKRGPGRPKKESVA